MDLFGYIKSADHKIMLVKIGEHKALPFMHISQDDDPIESLKHLISKISGIDISWYDILQNEVASNDSTYVYTVTLEDMNSDEIMGSGDKTIVWEDIDMIDYKLLTKEARDVLKAIS